MLRCWRTGDVVRTACSWLWCFDRDRSPGYGLGYIVRPLSVCVNYISTALDGTLYGVCVMTDRKGVRAWIIGFATAEWFVMLCHPYFQVVRVPRGYK